MEPKTKNIVLWSIAGLVVLALLLLVLLPSTEDNTGKVTFINQVAEDKIPIKVGYKATSHYLTVFVAKEKGYFDEQGLDAELIEFQNTNHIVDGVLSGSLDAGRGALVKQFQIELQQPGTLKTFMVNKQTKENYIDSLIVRKDSSVKLISDLKGKIIATNEGSTESSFLKVILKKSGLGAGDYTLVTMKPDLLPAALEAGSIDAFFSYEPVTTVAISKSGAKVLSAAPIENYIIDPLVSGGIFMRADYIVKNPVKAKKIVAAFYKAAEFIQAHPEECPTIIAKYTSLDPEMNAQLHIIGEYPVTDAWVLGAVQEHADVLYQEGVLEKNIDVSKMLVDLR